MKRTTRDIVFVTIQCCLFLLYVIEIKSWIFDRISIFNYTGVALAGIGVVVLIMALVQLSSNLSPFPSPKPTAQLIQHGLYGYVRHPIYTGILLIAFGMALYMGSFFKILVFIALYALFYYKSLYEEQRLMLFFPSYGIYKNKTGRFMPKISKQK